MPTRGGTKQKEMPSVPDTLPLGIQHWVASQSNVEPSCQLSPRTIETLSSTIYHDLTADVAPFVPGRRRRPVFVGVTGMPGSGKSTMLERIIRAILDEDGGGGDYVKLDMDTAVRWHPLGRSLYHLHDPNTGEALPVGDVDRLHSCYHAVQPAYAAAERRILQEANRHVVADVLRGNAQFYLHRAHDAGYETVLVYVHTPRAMAIERMRRRTRKTGMFIERDHAVEIHRYIRDALPWWCMWVDRSFWVDGQTARDEEPRMIELTDLAQRKDWRQRLARTREALRAHGAQLEDERPRRRKRDDHLTRPSY